MNTPPSPKLYLFPAAESPDVLILRRGPSATFRMILWRRDTDGFQDGQWLKSKVYPERCHLSPDGRHFLYFALDAKWCAETRGAFTAVSRVPYWTALALFPEGNTWAGGGVFLDDHHYLASGDADIVGRDAGLQRVVQGEVEADCATGLRLLNGKRAPLSRRVTRALLAPPQPKDARAVAHRLPCSGPSSLPGISTDGACLYRIVNGERALIRDMTDMAFEPIRAPYDWRSE